MGEARSEVGSGRGGLKLLLQLSPVLVPFVVIFLGGFFLALAQSLGYMVPVPGERGFSVGLGRVLADSSFYASFGFSFYVAFFSAGLSVVFGTALAYLIWRMPPGWRSLAVIYKVPLVLPHIAVAFIVLVLWTQSGFVASIGHSLGLIDRPAQFPPLLFAGNGLGLILAYTYKGSAFVILMVHAVLFRLDQRLPATAAMLGASRWTVFFRVVLPHLGPVLNTSFIILFLYSFGAFDIPFLLSESYPGMLSIKVYNLYFQRDLVHRPEAMAVLVVMFIFSAFFIYLYTRAISRFEPKERKL